MQTEPVTCPFCGQPITLVVDISAGNQTYTEDCEVCCRPIQVDVRCTREGEVQVAVRPENE